MFLMDLMCAILLLYCDLTLFSIGNYFVLENILFFALSKLK
ncbi:hypothetical protein HMPREF2531_01168 [Bacteroides intestinalis]|uniref:Uncharacterized protein n=2 Tax=Bacteroides TaxID=816 RepID=A0A139LQX4_9BACE|nr:hypothetical protein BACCELL_00302 [Bacteroides cellulosilyticus DSM 14838]KXT53861.1 hypothetical protein HMPREF2531_01168 [Bacteroides intestinalis]